ncbi:MAG: tRNA lysidine(34) synthetase TilS [bacterium]
MLAKVKNTINEHQLLNRGDAVLVALSGGPDSVALLHLLTHLQRPMGLKLTAVYVNHQIRPDAALREERFCRKLCDRLGMELTIVSEDLPALARASKKTLEEAARDFRYQLFARLALEQDIDRIAVAHHRDDRAETILFRILRGTGTSGLAGMPIRRDKIIRPLFEVTKKDILVYLKRHRLKYCVDESNRDCTFARNFIRNRLLPDIRDHLNTNVDGALLNLSETVHREEAYLQEIVQKIRKKIVQTTVGGKIELDLNRFDGYDVWLRNRLLRYCLVELSPTGRMPDKIVVERLDESCRRRNKGFSLPEKVQAAVVRDRLVLFRKNIGAYSQELVPGRKCSLPQLRLSFYYSRPRTTGDRVVRERRARKVLLDRDRLSPPLIVRNIRRGDRFVPLGMKGSKRVGDYLTDRKVAGVYRDEIPVVCDGKGIVWLVGFEIADRVKIDNRTEKVVAIEVAKSRRITTDAV